MKQAFRSWNDLSKKKSPSALGQYDQGNALLRSTRARGTDSQDWAAMLERMYLRWAELKVTN